MRERQRQQDEGESAASERSQQERGDESYGGDPDAEPATTEEDAEHIAERTPAEG